MPKLSIIKYTTFFLTLQGYIHNKLIKNIYKKLNIIVEYANIYR